MQSLTDLMELIGGDPYEVLESQPNCQLSTLRKNYRALAIRYHPDKNKQQSAKYMFLKVNQAYEYLQIESNRIAYQNHIKALQQKKKRMASKDEQTRKFAQDLKRREQQYQKTQKEMEKQLQKRKEFFRKKMEQQQERDAIRQQIFHSIGTQQYYQLVSSFDIEWQQCLSFTEQMLRFSFSDYGKITKIVFQPKRNKAKVTFNSIEDCTKLVGQFKHPMIKVTFHLEGEKRNRLLKALQKQKSQKIDLSLTSANIERFKEIMNRGSGLYRQDNRQNI